ncbi:hypothetical protein KIKIMORA_02920 [Brevundimonas phage vB_BpoS-Kikimora]|uniref:Uncharacterized protein n=1 Tax=Brevundimonas phage vB_BpoS-Kikimora TaxID=2948601 RepID=A0A9E7MRR3_9CAUD|nr:hypothetical protein KIKIMORA_02920 [Brevundimonas phage vB_BpoS-Kikimora]
MTFATRRIVRDPKGFVVERRSWLWPFWTRRKSEVSYGNEAAARCVVDAELAVDAYIRRDPLEVWRG